MDEREFRAKAQVVVDESGRFVATCPECGREIKVAIDNIKDERLALKEKMECPLCGKEIVQVFPSEVMWRQIEDKVLDEILGEFKK